MLLYTWVIGKKDKRSSSLDECERSCTKKVKDKGDFGKIVFFYYSPRLFQLFQTNLEGGNVVNDLLDGDKREYVRTKVNQNSGSETTIHKR